MSSHQLRALINKNLSSSIALQCSWVGISRGSYYQRPNTLPVKYLEAMKMIDMIYLNYPFYGIRRIKLALKEFGINLSLSTIARLMRAMCIEAIYPKPKTTQRNENHSIYPYLLRNLNISKPNEVWATDITYIPVGEGFMYLCAVIDWYSRMVLSWQISNSMQVEFCVQVLEQALNSFGVPKIFNTDQGSQFTSHTFLNVLKSRDITPSMDGRGRATDNAIIERLWRSVKYENVYINDYQSVNSLRDGLTRYFRYYNEHRPHSSLANKPPLKVYESDKN